MRTTGPLIAHLFYECQNLRVKVPFVLDQHLDIDLAVEGSCYVTTPAGPRYTFHSPKGRCNLLYWCLQSGPTLIHGYRVAESFGHLTLQVERAPFFRVNFALLGYH